MELKATSIGKRFAQHPYDRVEILTAGVKVSGDNHQYLIPFNQLLAINCKRGMVWGELEFVVANHQVVRLHGTQWNETQRFYQHLAGRWEHWSQEMSEIAASVLNGQCQRIAEMTQPNTWLKRQDIQSIQRAVRAMFSTLPLPLSRLTEFASCRDAYLECSSWLHQAEKRRQQANQQFTERMLSQHADFFQQVESSPLNPSQARAVVNGEASVLVLAGAGSGKTSVLVARAGWLMVRGEASAGQILLLAFGRKAAQEMDQRIHERLHTDGITARTFHALALYIIQHGNKKAPQISKLESDTAARHRLLITEWRQQCQQKKAQAKGWRQWLNDDLDWGIEGENYWQDDKLARRLAPRLERWLGIIRMHGGSQAEMIASVPDEMRELFQKRIKLMAPLVKVWKSALKAEGAVDFSGLIHQAVNVLDTGRFVSPWKHILVDEFQDISPQRAALLTALRRQNSHTALYAVGDDWQAIYRFSGAALLLTTSFTHHFGEGDQCALDTTYRFNDRIGQIANSFVQQNPHQLVKPLNSLKTGDKTAVTLLPDEQLEPLLDKLSGFAMSDERILVLSRYHHLQPAVLEKAEIRWPKLNIDFMTIHASKGQQADYVIVIGLQNGKEGFPAPARESIIEQGLLPQPEDFPDAQERRLLYVALTRARHRVWLLYSKPNPSRFVPILEALGVPVAKKP